MLERVRSSLWAKMVAMVFIYMIVLGNIWLTMLVIGKPAPHWLQESFSIGILLMIFCGFGLWMQALRAPR